MRNWHLDRTKQIINWIEREIFEASFKEVSDATFEDLLQRLRSDGLWVVSSSTRSDYRQLELDGWAGRTTIRRYRKVFNIETGSPPLLRKVKKILDR